MNYISRFYGSCGHIEDDIISEERFIDLTSEKIFKSIVGNLTIKNSTTIEEDWSIVHIYPIRYCCCLKCMMEDI